jgi:hypothetical protein
MSSILPPFCRGHGLPARFYTRVHFGSRATKLGNAIEKRVTGVRLAVLGGKRH